jgi:hypothetical protein
LEDGDAEKSEMDPDSLISYDIDRCSVGL